MNADTPLAWLGRAPAPFKPLYASELSTPEQVSCLFCCCSVLEGHITAEGWRFLVRKFGVPQLLEIDRAEEIDWFWWGDDDCDEARESLLYKARISGYDPDSDRFGEYNEATGEFLAK
jgi:hypothetical protein